MVERKRRMRPTAVVLFWSPPLIRFRLTNLLSIFSCMNKKLKEGFLVCFSRILSFTHLVGKTGRLAELKSELVCPV